MFLYSTFLLNILILAVACQNITNTSLIALNPNSTIELGKSLNRTRREDKLKHTAVCGELDGTEDTPFMVIITTRNYGRLLCMGTIIDEYHVLTAKNCTKNADIGSLTIIGGYMSPYWGKNSQVKYCEKIILHDKELAILLLRKPFFVTETVKPIKIIGPEKMNEKDFQKAYLDPYFVIGFEVPKSLKQSDKLPKESAYHMVEEKLQNNTYCKTCYDIVADTDPTGNIKFCTDGKSEFGWGGMGSPVIIVIQKEFVQVGVVLNGQCGTPDTKKHPLPHLNLFTRTDRFYKWIKANSYIGR